MRVLIIGGTGFIGRWIVRALVEQAHEVQVFHRGRTIAALPPSVAHIQGERAELPRFAPLFRAWTPDVVLDTFAYDRNDLALVARATEEITCRFVLLSSMDVYRAYGIYCRLEEGAPDTRMFDEKAPLRTVLYPYRKNAASVDDLLYRYDKIPAEQFAMNEMNRPVTILRLGKVYGPGDPQRHAQDYLEQVRRGRARLSKERSEWRWSRTYVENAAEAVALAIAAKASVSRIYNVADEPVLTERAWMEAVARANGCNVEIETSTESPESADRHYEWRQHLCADTTRIRQELGWREKYDLEEALRCAFVHEG
ncbi:MAG TPA: NAD-dependent epimerase/dehydratase family protein [Chthoniobacterales bacterium]|nr:NAD-dependent epimerase/dehydratase family protein [Chthoniobacterales bacterium]